MSTTSSTWLRLLRWKFNLKKREINMHTHKTPIQTSNAPAPVGPYSVAISAGGMLFCSGQIGLDPKSQAMVKGGVEAEARQAMENIKAVLNAAGGTLECIVKTTI